jgi:CHAT domain-containing protein
LRGTELVVLSACETGLGDIEYGEGVFGLQRAFGNAGAKKLLLSLRKVDDEATALLMTSFYKFLLKNFDAEDALLKACKVVKKKFPHPYYWGSFVLVNL